MRLNLTTSLLSLLLLFGFVQSAESQNSKFMPVDEIQAGMRGTGRTVFKGTAIEDFQVEILGVLRNFAPKQDMILARLSGGPLEHTGTIQGMSGSPVYINGRMIGAVAFAYQFSKDPIAGIQPIGQMINLLDQKPAAARAASVGGALFEESPAEYVTNLMSRFAAGQSLQQLLVSPLLTNTLPGGASGNVTLTRIQTPVFMSGVTAAAVQQFAPFFQSLGLNPIQGGGVGSAVGRAQSSTRLEPGSAVNVEMVRGDISVSANGTVTHVDGNKVFAFGHPFLSAGPLDLPMSQGFVVSLLPNVSNSFKIAAPMNVVGAFQQDRATGIFGQLGAAPKMIPVTLNVNSNSSTVNRYKFEVANDRFLTPFLMNFSVFNAITASERALGEMTLNISGKIRLKDFDAVNVQSIFTGDMNGPAAASIATVAPIQYLLSSAYDDLNIQGVELEITSMDRKTSALLDRISVDKIEVRPGEKVALTAHLRGTKGESFTEKYMVEIPQGLPTGPLQLLVGDGNTVTTTDIRRGPAGAPKDLRQAIKELNSLRKNDRLYIKLLTYEPGFVIGGEEMPSLPPSMVAVIDTDRSSSRRVTTLRNSTVREYELPQSQYVIQGQRTLNLAVVQ